MTHEILCENASIMNANFTQTRITLFWKPHELLEKTEPGIVR